MAAYRTIKPYALEPKTGDRRAIISGGFQPGTYRADIEEALRTIMEEY